MEDNRIKRTIESVSRDGAVYLVKALSIAVMSCILSTSAAAASSENSASVSPTVGDLYRAFETVVFGSEFGNKKPRNKVLKWDQPLRISVQAYEDGVVDHGHDVKEVVFRKVPLTPFQIKVVENHLSTLIRLTNIETEDYKKFDKEPNLTINYVPRFQMANPVLASIAPKRLRQLASQQGCYFVLWRDPKTSSIERAVIVVNADSNEQQISHCILEEMTQSLGLPNDNNVKWPSIFSNSQKTPHLSRSDEILLQTLYDPKIKSGMLRKDVMRYAQKRIRSLDATLPTPKATNDR